jgi:molybdopterin-containing oxidoreductase family iron-sulfur binding subunit
MSRVRLYPHPQDRTEMPARERRPTQAEVNRREALKVLSAGLALPLAGCGKPNEEIVPYVDMPERMTPGEPLQFASALPLEGVARGVVVTSIDGRPIKVSGNPRHPASLGSTDIFAEAEVLALYDPDRSRTVRGADPIATWNDFLAALWKRLDAAGANKGAGLRIVTGPVTSPTLRRQVAEVLRRFPSARWHAYSGVDRGEAGIIAAFGRPLTLVPRMAEADVVVALGADPLGPGPMQIMNSRGFAERRKPGGPSPPIRLYSLESTWTLTGANADHRLAVSPSGLRATARALVARLASGEPASGTPDPHFVEAIAADVEAHRGHALLLPGQLLDQASQAAVHATNRRLNAPVDYLEPLDDGVAPTPIQDFLKDLDGGRVSDVLFFDCNPVYDLALDDELVGGLKAAAFSAHLGTHENETSEFCGWHLPMSHPLEAWSDLRAPDGTASIVQPLIRPLYETRSVHEVVCLLTSASECSGYDLVRETWRGARSDEAFGRWWRQALHDGVLPGTRFAQALGVEAHMQPPPALPVDEGAFVGVIDPDPTIHDGRYANNAWLQECPKPLSKEVWSNAIALSPVDAAYLGVVSGDVVSVGSRDGEIKGSVRVDAGQANGVVGLTRGYGRTRCGAIGNDLGYSPAALAPGRIVVVVGDVSVMPTGERSPIPTTQAEFNLEGKAAELLPLVTAADPERLARERREERPRQSFLDPRRAVDGYRWAMAIDTAACIGCNACVVACQAENNVPVVGPDEVARGRIMHWLRIDRYELNNDDAPRPGFEPVPCMHCEEAPCEPVCPVEASVHDVEGLNVQVYNRCIGTRFCQSNCPYKVRRFNWFGYADGQEYANLGEVPMRAQKNPDVTVRARGVMEKCTYCVQRISRARRAAERDDRVVADGEVVTACQAACPTRAISFGNLEDPKAEVNARKADPRHFTLLEQLGTKPRTTYLARLVNPNPAIEGGGT